MLSPRTPPPAEVSFVDRCADQPGTAYTYRVKARRGDQLSRWGNYSRVDLAADYVSADPQTGCDPDTGAPPTDPDPGNSDDVGTGDGDPDGGEGVVADSPVSVESDASDQQNNQDNKQLVPTPDEDEGEIVVPRSSLQNTDSAQFQDRSALSGLPASYPNALGFDPGAPPAFATCRTGRRAMTLRRFAPRNVTAELTDDGILISMATAGALPEWWACAELRHRAGARHPHLETSGHPPQRLQHLGGDSNRRLLQVHLRRPAPS